MLITVRLLSRRDLDFLLFEWLDVALLCDRPRFADHSRDTFAAVLELSEQIAAEQFAPHYRRSDAEEPVVRDGRVRIIPDVKAAVDAFGKAGLVGAAMDHEVGGFQLPMVVTSACFAWFQAANISTAAYPFLTVANANLLRTYGTSEQIETFVLPQVEGRWFGTMCLSEPQAGSSLADVTTRAEPQSDGTYRLTGTKMWISGGDHDLVENIVHLVLARIAGAPTGVRGISLFVVPKLLPTTGERNDVVLAGLNHKMGYRGTVNTVLNFGEGAYRPGGRGGAIGELVGEPHRGLEYMFHMMNEARIGVGAGAAALGYRAYLTALDYARSRPQGRPRATRDPSEPQVPIIGHADVRRMLLAQKSYVEGALALVLYCARLVDEVHTGPEESRADAQLLLDVLTPIAKSWPSQWCLTACDLAIQVHGGYGYTRDYDVEQLYRDNRLNPIHEGTQGIQGLDLLGRKVVMADGRALRLLLEAVGNTATRARSAPEELAGYGNRLTAAAELLAGTVADLYAAGDIDVTLANSSLFLDAAGHVVIAWMWLEQAVAAPGQDPFHTGKRAAARYFFRYELPRAEQQLQFLRTCDTTTLDMQPEWF
jgi:butyryl-CoA dehydrogenase